MPKQAQAIKDRTHIFLRPIASGVPLGFFSFAIGSLLISCSALHIIPVEEAKQLGLILVLFVFPLEFIAAIFAFLARDTMSAATLGLFSTSWLVTGVLLITTKPGSTSKAFAVYLFGFAFSLLLIAILAYKAKPFFTVLLAIALARLVFDGIYEFGGKEAFLTAGGIFGLALMAMAFYGGVAFTLEDMHKKAVLPLFRRGAAQDAFGGYEKQLKQLEAEPGIRHQL